MKEVNYSEISRTRQMVEARRKKNRNLIIGTILVIILASLGIYFIFTQEQVVEGDIEGLNVQLQKDWTSYEDSLENDTLEIEQLTKEVIEEEIEAYIKSMSLDNKISQLIITTPESLIGISQVVQAGSATKKKIAQYPVGGLIFSEKNFETVTQLQEIINSVIIYSSYPMLISINEVGGTRVENTHTKLEEVNVNLLYKEEALLISDGENSYGFEDLKISLASNQKQAVEMLSQDFEMIIIESDYETYHNAIYKAIINGDIDQETINNKLKSVLEYKITKM